MGSEGVRLTAGQTAEVFHELTGSRGVALSMVDPLSRLGNPLASDTLVPSQPGNDSRWLWGTRVEV